TTPLTFGPSPCRFGSIQINIVRGCEARATGNHVTVSWSARWHAEAPTIEIRLPGFAPVIAKPGTECVELESTGP
ncbi:MAG TPA: hypothetical protein DCZ13_14085, partial [Porticoccaceae bacterium]|nr:hypothetical protein [Porticoccaceae bacterium]